AVAAPALRRRGGAAEFFGDFYALILAVVIYTAIGVLNRAAGVSHDLTVQAWEEALFRGQPSLDWIRAPDWAWLSWPMHLAYLSYYFILAGAPLGLLLAGRRQEAAAAATLIMCAFYVCYAIFAFFPVAGPRYAFTLARNAATANAAAQFTQTLLNSAGAWGTAFPSSHVAAAITAGLCAWRGWRPLGAVLLPAAVLMTLGTVYGQFHYAVDALAGVLVAAGVGILRSRIVGAPQRRRTNR
ncbi:MAG TPA: phosphatase PAP2 family protein, partial [Vicinamibacteria bacterium]|nr:phosphatase PAP2 family protein [Vicinamibacteria bacterium]